MARLIMEQFFNLLQLFFRRQGHECTESRQQCHRIRRRIGNTAMAFPQPLHNVAVYKAYALIYFAQSGNDRFPARHAFLPE